MGAEQVAARCHRGELGQVGDQGGRLRQVVDDRDPVEQPDQRRAHRLRALHHLDGVRRAVGQDGPGPLVGTRRPGEQQPGPAEVVGPQVRHRGDRGGGVADGDGVGGRAEGAGDGGLVARAHREQRRDRAEQARHRAVVRAEAASSAPAPSLRFSPISSASLRAASVERSRSACSASPRALARRSSTSSRALAAPSCSASRPSSPASRPATRTPGR